MSGGAAPVWASWAACVREAEKAGPPGARHAQGIQTQLGSPGTISTLRTHRWARQCHFRPQVGGGQQMGTWARSMAPRRLLAVRQRITDYALLWSLPGRKKLRQLSLSDAQVPHERRVGSYVIPPGGHLPSEGRGKLGHLLGLGYISPRHFLQNRVAQGHRQSCARRGLGPGRASGCGLSICRSTEVQSRRARGILADSVNAFRRLAPGGFPLFRVAGWAPARSVPSPQPLSSGAALPSVTNRPTLTQVQQDQ